MSRSTLTGSGMASARADSSLATAPVDGESILMNGGEPTCVEADPSEGGFVWVEATEAIPSGETALAFWLAHDSEPNDVPHYRLIGPTWMRETDAAVFFGGDQAWEECRESDTGARKFWKLEPS